MELKDVHPKHGNNSLQLSHMHTNFYTRPTTPHKIINHAKSNPPPFHIKTHDMMFQLVPTCEATKGGFLHSFHSIQPKQGRGWKTEAIPCIDIVSHMWLGFPINEEIERHRGTPIMNNTCSNIKYHKVGTPSSKIIKFWTLRVLKKLFPTRGYMLVQATIFTSPKSQVKWWSMKKPSYSKASHYHPLWCWIQQNF